MCAASVEGSSKPAVVGLVTRARVEATSSAPPPAHERRHRRFRTRSTCRPRRVPDRRPRCAPRRSRPAPRCRSRGNRSSTEARITAVIASMSSDVAMRSSGARTPTAEIVARNASTTARLIASWARTFSARSVRTRTKRTPGPPAEASTSGMPWTAAERDEIDAVGRAEQLLERLAARARSPAAGTRRCRRRRCRRPRSSRSMSRVAAPSRPLVSCRKRDVADQQRGRRARSASATPTAVDTHAVDAVGAPVGVARRTPARGAANHSTSRTGIDDDDHERRAVGERRRSARAATPGSVGSAVERRGTSSIAACAGCSAACHREPRRAVATRPPSRFGESRRQTRVGSADDDRRRPSIGIDPRAVADDHDLQRVARTPATAPSTFDAGGVAEAQHDLRAVVARRTADAAADGVERGDRGRAGTPAARTGGSASTGQPSGVGQRVHAPRLAGAAARRRSRPAAASSDASARSSTAASSSARGAATDRRATAVPSARPGAAAARRRRRAARGTAG